MLDEAGPVLLPILERRWLVKGIAVVTILKSH